MRQKKRLYGLTASLAVLLLLAVLCMAAPAAAAGGTTGNLTWDLTDGTLTISGEGAMPDYSDGGAPWYSYQSLITSVVIEDGVLSIGSYAFSGCSSLTFIDIPSSVTSIGSYAFLGCSSLTSVVSPSNVTSIGSYAFWDCSNLTSVTFAEGSLLTSIGSMAFAHSGLTSVVIPSNVTSIGSYAFSGCSSLTSVFIPSGVLSIGNYAFSDCSSLISIELPSNVTYIGYSAFYSLAANSIIYCTNASLLSGTYSTDLTALAVKNVDGSYTFNSSVTSLALSAANAPSGITYGGWFAESTFTTPVTSIAAGTNPTLWLKSSVPADVLCLSPGWNFVSVPKKLAAAYDTAAELFGSVNTSGNAVLFYNAETKLWEQVTGETVIEPLNAYWIYSADDDVVSPSFDSGIHAPPMTGLYKGWNAVGLSAEEHTPASVAFNGLNWRSYLSWNAAERKYNSPILKGGSGKYSDENLVYLWKGGWVYMEEDGTYIGYA